MLQNVDVKKFFELTVHKVTHFGGAPIVLNMIANAPKEDQKPIEHKVNVMTAGAPPPPSRIITNGAIRFRGDTSLWPYRTYMDI